jgi:hypothetical protein
MSGEAQRLAGIRGALDAIAPAIWTRAADDAGEFVEARGEMGELLEVVRFHPGATVCPVSFAGMDDEHCHRDLPFAPSEEETA